MLLVRDLSLIAKADGYIEPNEIKVIEEIASGLGVSPEIVWSTFKSSTELDCLVWVKMVGTRFVGKVWRDFGFMCSRWTIDRIWCT